MNILKQIKGDPSFYLILGIIFLQNPVWILWGIPYTAISFLFCIVLFIKNRNVLKRLNNAQALIIAALFLCFVIFPLLHGSVHWSSVVYILCYIAAYSISKEDSERVLTVLSKILGAVVGVSLVAWLINMFVHPLPVVGTSDLTAMKGTPTIMENYLFFVQNTEARSFRFYSVFDEPGVLGTLGAFLLYANQYQFRKWYNLCIFLGCLFTMSMAFYILTAVGLVYVNLKSPRRIIITIVTLGACLYLLSPVLKDSDDFDSLIVSRMMNLSGSVEHRTEGAVNDYYDKMSTTTFLLGVGEEEIVRKGLNEGASYKTFIIDNGFIALVVLFLAYFLLIRKKTSAVLVFVVIFWLSFAQRPTSFNGWQMLLYTCIVNRFGYRYKKNNFNTNYKTEYSEYGIVK